MKSGKVTMGTKTTMKTIRSGKAKLVLIAANCPPLRKSELEYVRSPGDLPDWLDTDGSDGHARQNPRAPLPRQQRESPAAPLL